MKGYNTSNGYMGYVEGKYILFASEQEYFEFMEDWEGGRSMSKVYFTLTGTKNYFGKEFLKKGTKIRLEKELDNEYDKEAIKVTYEGLPLLRHGSQRYWRRKGCRAERAVW